MAREFNPESDVGVTEQLIEKLTGMKAVPIVTGMPGILTGPAAPAIQAASPRLAQFLQRAPDEVYAQRTLLDPGVLGETVTNPIVNLVRMLIRRPPVIDVGLAARAGAKTAAHEGLHAAYFTKGLGGFPPEKFIPQLSQHYIGKYPHLQGYPAGEVVIDGMAREVLRRGAMGATPAP